MTKDTLLTGNEARQGLINGIRKASQAVGITMGTSGSNSLIEAIENPGHYATNDGATILNSIRFADPLEEMGRKILVEAVSRANKQSGDGSSTTCVLTAAIIEEGQKHLKDHSAMEIKRSLEACIPQIEESIKKQTRQITVDEVGAVAAISAEDSEIGQRIQEIYQQIGKTGIIHWDVSKTPEDTYTIGSGLTIDEATYASPYFCDADQSGRNTNQIRLKDPKILITKQKITGAAEFEGLFAKLYEDGMREVVVFCDEYEPLMINDLIMTRAQRGFRATIVKMPVLWKDQWFEDLSIATGATIIDAAKGIALKDAKEEHLGTVGHIHISKDATYIDGIKDLTEHIHNLRESSADDDLVRIDRLNTKTARYYVGAHSESALAYRRLKVEDAISAAWQALNGGIVAGGGVALLQSAKELDYPSLDIELDTGKEMAPITVGVEILRAALRAPLGQICTNAGYSVDAPVTDTEFDTRIFKKGINSNLDLKENHGLNTRTGKIVDMFEAQITDPANIVFNAAKNAISVAAAVLTAETVVLLPREQQQQIMVPPQI